MSEESLREIKLSCHPTYNFVVTSKSKCLSSIVCCENFSWLQRLLRVTAYKLNFIDVLKVRIKKVNITLSSELTAAELGRAEKLWIIESEKCVKEDWNFTSWQNQFNLFLDEGVWRCKGRLGNTEILYNSARCPALLHKHHHITLLIIRDAHQWVMHNEVKETLTEIRSRFWIIRGRQLLKMVLNKCATFIGMKDSHTSYPHHHLSHTSEWGINQPLHTLE